MIYLYGVVITSRSFLLWDKYPPADGYAEIKESHFLVGGETGTAAAILAGFGCELALGGTDTGTENDKTIREYFADKNVDLSGICYNADFAGVTDNIIIDRDTRTCFGEFGRLNSLKIKWFGEPDEAMIAKANVVGADPFYGDEIAHICKRLGKKYATIDCAYDSDMNRYCAINAVSHQHLDGNYPGMSYEELFGLYTQNTDGLVIFTMGENEVMYGRKNRPPKYFKPYSLDVVSTLGAGDSFKAGTIYALDKGMNDDETVEFACATAGCACTAYPIAENLPTLEKVNRIIESRK